MLGGIDHLVMSQWYCSVLLLDLSSLRIRRPILANDYLMTHSGAGIAAIKGYKNRIKNSNMDLRPGIWQEPLHNSVTAKAL